jgi:hypothetical protein
MLRKLIRAGAIVAICVGPAAAQDPGGSLGSSSHLSVPLNQQAPPTAEEIAKQKASDRAYDAAMKKIPDKKSSADPWGDVRPMTPSAARNRQQ